MKNKAKLFGLYLPVFAIMLTAALILRTVALFLNFNFNTGYFAEKTLIGISDYITVACAVFFFTYIFTARRNLRLIPDFTSPATYIPTGVVTVSLVFMITVLVAKATQIKNFIELLADLAATSESARAQLPSQRLFFVIVLITAILAAFSAVHFVLTALIEKNSSVKRAGYGIFTVMFLSFYALYLYFSTDLPINAPNKTLDQISYLLAAVFFLYETRLSLGREKWRAYIGFGFISSFVGIYSSLPAIIIYFARGTVISNSIYESALTLSLSAFILSRILLTGELIEDTPSQTVSSLVEFFDARDAKINPAPSVAEVIELSGEMLSDTAADDGDDGNQLTIEDVAAYKEEDSNPSSPEKAAEDATVIPTDATEEDADKATVAEEGK